MMATPYAETTKDADAVRFFTLDWSDWLNSGETITASSWTVTTGVTVGTGPKAPSFTDSTATLWLSAGTENDTYYAVNHITTSLGQVDDRTLSVRIVQN